MGSPVSGWDLVIRYILRVLSGLLQRFPPEGRALLNQSAVGRRGRELPKTRSGDLASRERDPGGRFGSRRAALTAREGPLRYFSYVFVISLSRSFLSHRQDKDRR